MKKNNNEDKQSNNNQLLQQEELSIVTSSDHSSSPLTRKNIALDTLSRYSGSDPEAFQKYILLTNFPKYVDLFAEQMNTTSHQGSLLKVSHSINKKITIIDYRLGAPMAALVVDILSYIKPEVVIMLGLCGGLRTSQKIGDYLLPIAAIRDEGASRHYMPLRVPSLPAFLVQHFISQVLINKALHFYTGVLHTTDYRMWEFDEKFRANLNEEQATAIDMECSALFTVGFAKKVPIGALMLISDLPFKQSGIKTKATANAVFKQYAHHHLELGIQSLLLMQEKAKEKKIDFRRYQFN